MCKICTMSEAYVKISRLMSDVDHQFHAENMPLCGQKATTDLVDTTVT